MLLPSGFPLYPPFWHQKEGHDIEIEPPKGIIPFVFRCLSWCDPKSNSLESGKGVGTALVKAVTRAADTRDCKRVWLITTNDNTGSIRLYQKTGFELVTIHRHAIDESRKLKPSIPEMGYDGIPIRDEIELEMRLP